MFENLSIVRIRPCYYHSAFLPVNSLNMWVESEFVYMATVKKNELIVQNINHMCKGSTNGGTTNLKTIGKVLITETKSSLIVVIISC